MPFGKNVSLTALTNNCFTLGQLYDALPQNAQVSLRLSKENGNLSLQRRQNLLGHSDALAI
jgi:hypothetical protein